MTTSKISEERVFSALTNSESSLGDYNKIIEDLREGDFIMTYRLASRLILLLSVSPARLNLELFLEAIRMADKIDTHLYYAIGHYVGQLDDNIAIDRILYALGIWDCEPVWTNNSVSEDYKIALRNSKDALKKVMKEKGVIA